MTIEIEQLPGLPAYKRSRMAFRGKYRLNLRTDRELPTPFILRRYAERALLLVTMCCVASVAIVLWDLWDKIHAFS